MMNAKIGIFVHYRSGQSDFAYGKPNPQPWDLDAHADTFDVNAFADAVEDIGAQYVIMTSFHASMKIEQKTRPWPMVRMDSADGSTVYVHVLIPQAAGAQARDGFRDLGALQTYNTNKEQVVSRRRHEEHEALKDESNSPSCSS